MATFYISLDLFLFLKPLIKRPLIVDLQHGYVPWIADMDGKASSNTNIPSFFFLLDWGNISPVTGGPERLAKDPVTGAKLINFIGIGRGENRYC